MKIQSIIQKSEVFFTIVILFSMAESVLAEVRTITATGEYRMGDNDTRADAKRLALLDAKRLALEQAGVYIESITEVKNFDLVKEEIRAYTAGIVEVIEQTARTVMEGDTTVVRVNVTAKIDTDVVTRQIQTLRQNQNAKSMMREAESRLHKLQEELAAETRKLVQAKSKAGTQELSQMRRQIISRIEADELATKAGVTLVETWRDRLQTGLPPYAALNYARPLLNRAFLLDPQNASAHYWNGFLQFMEGNYRESAQSYRNVVNLEPNSAVAHTELGISLQLMGDSAGAAQEFAIAIQKDPGFASAYASLGSLVAYEATIQTFSEQEKLRQYEQAARLIRRAIDLEPSEARNHLLLGRLLAVDMKDVAGALVEFRTAVHLAPASSDAHSELGFALSKSGDNDGAVEAYRTAIQLAPYNLQPRRSLAFLFKKHRNFSAAIAEYQEIIRLEPGIADNHWKLGQSLEDGGKIEQAIPHYFDAYKISGSHSFHAYFLISALAKIGRKDEASRILREFHTRHPEDETMRRSLKQDGLLELYRE